MRRSYSLDVLVCPRCSGAMRVIAFIDNQRVASRILQHLGLPTTTQIFRLGRDPPQTEFTWDDGGGADAEPDYAWGDPISDDLN